MLVYSYNKFKRTKWKKYREIKNCKKKTKITINVFIIIILL